MSTDPVNQEDGKPPLPCGRCGRLVVLGRGECYLVDIRAVADPTPPVFNGDDLSRDASKEIKRLLARLRGLSEKQLVDQVYRRRLFCLCNACYARWVEDPVGDGRSSR
jgi:hypothetical protein